MEKEMQGCLHSLSAQSICSRKKLHMGGNYLIWLYGDADEQYDNTQHVLMLQ